MRLPNLISIPIILITLLTQISCSKDYQDAAEMYMDIYEAKNKLNQADYDAIDSYWEKKFSLVSEKTNCEAMPSEDDVLLVIQQKNIKVCQALKNNNITGCFIDGNQIESTERDEQIQCVRAVYNKVPSNEEACDLFDNVNNFFVKYKAECLAYQKKSIDPCVALGKLPPINSLLKTVEPNSLEVMNCLAKYLNITGDLTSCEQVQSLHNQFKLKDQIYKNKNKLKLSEVCI